MRLVSLFSGGKDSVLALHVAKNAGHDIVALLAVLPQNAESFLYHVPNIHQTKWQAESMGIPLVIVHTKGEKEAELADLKNALFELKKSAKIEGVVTGAVFSTYQSTRIQNVCAELGLTCYNPVWQANPNAHWHELLLHGFEVMLVSVAAQGLGKEWLGRIIDERNVEELFALEKKYGVSSIGEGGEFESFVLNAPLFQKRLVVNSYKESWKGMQGTRTITSVKMSKKMGEKNVAKKKISKQKKPKMTKKLLSRGKKK